MAVYYIPVWSLGKRKFVTVIFWLIMKKFFDLVAVTEDRNGW